MTGARESLTATDRHAVTVQPITVRKGAFDFPESTPAHWIPRAPEFAQMINGASFVMPHLEPFLIATVSEAGRMAKDAAIQKEAHEFCQQESQHFRAHRRFNDVLLEHGYDALKAVERDMARSYARLAKRPLGVRLAYAAGFEAMTLGLTGWLVGKRVQLFAGADARVTSFILWHMVEETEHKLVAHDVYCAVTPGYWRRAFGVLHGSFDVMRWTRRSYVALLKHDGRWNTLAGRLSVWAWVLRFAGGAGPALLKALLPGHDPRDIETPDWVEQWISGYARAVTDRGRSEMPLIDTSSPSMPTPF